MEATSTGMLFLFSIFLLQLSAISGSEELKDWLPATEEAVKELYSDKCTIARVKAKDLDKEIFESRYRFEPFIIEFENGLSDWCNGSQWSVPSLIETYDDRNLQSGKAIEIVFRGGHGYLNTTFGDFIGEMRNKKTKEPTYLFDRDFYWESDLYKTIKLPEYLFDKGDSILFIGGTGTGAAFHKHMPAWNGVVYGMKRWFLYPVEKSPPGGMYAFPSDAWFKYVYPKLEEKDLPLECVQKPGEIFYVPESMYHTILNIGETVAISLQDTVVYSNTERLFYTAINSHYNATTLDDKEEKEKYYKISEEAYEYLHFKFPENLDILEHLAHMSCDKGFLDRCEVIIEYILGKDKFGIESKKLLSEIYYDRKDFTTAERLLRESVELYPESKSLLREYGNFLWDRNDTRAQDVFLQLLDSVDSQSEDAANVKAILDTNWGEGKEEEEEVEVEEEEVKADKEPEETETTHGEL